MYVMIFNAILAGIFTALESSINSQLGKHVTPSVATMYSLASGFVFMLIIRIIRGASPHLYFKVFTMSPVWLIGGFFGAGIIYLSSKAIPYFGISKALTIILAAQILTGMLLDLLFHGTTIDVYKVFGVLFLLFGVNLILR